MASRRYRLSSRPSRRSSRQGSARRFRWVVVTGRVSVAVNNVQPIQLLSPLLPPGTVADTQYQQMTQPTLIAVKGNVTVTPDVNYTLGVSQGARLSDFAWGLYVDRDFVTTGTALPPFSDGYSNAWMMHETDVITSPGYLADANQGAFASLGSIHYRRYHLNERRYKRKLDSFNDTLMFVFENGGPSLNLVVDTYFRLLLLE